MMIRIELPSVVGNDVIASIGYIKGGHRQCNAIAESTYSNCCHRHLQIRPPVICNNRERVKFSNISDLNEPISHS
jgi:hypothetical protein